MRLTATILGCGSSGGIPRIGNDWGLCDPQNPKNRRRRCSLLVEQRSESGTTRVLIDTSPDLREQMLMTGTTALDGVLYTHEHADHTHGIDELRAFYLMGKQRLKVWAAQQTGALLKTRFAYCFATQPGGDYPSILDLQCITPGYPIAITGQGGTITAQAFAVPHGKIEALGFRIGGMAYTPDINGMPQSVQDACTGLDLWIVDALKRTSHSSHFSLPETLHWIEKLKPKRAIITNMHTDMDYATLEKQLPSHIKPAFDGLTVEFE